MTDSSKLSTPEGKSADLPMLQGTHGPAVADVRGLNKDTGIFTYDPGFASTASCKSAITFIDGDEGILLYSCLLYTSPSPRDRTRSRMPSSA